MANVTITPSSVVPPTTSATTHLQPSTTIAGEIISAGETVCLLASDGKYYLADANDADKDDVRGIAGNSAVAIGQRLDVISASPALVVGTHGVAVGTPLFQSATPGKICPYADLSTGAFPILIAYSVSSTALQIVIAAGLAAKP